jgi:hypothetical protein
MSTFRHARTGLILAALGLNLGLGLSLSMSAAHAADAPSASKIDTVRPDLFKLVDPAQIKQLMDAKNYPEVQSRITTASALPKLSPYEAFVLNRLRISLASASGDKAMAITALEAVIESGKLTAAEQRDFIMALANEQYNAKDYPKAALWFLRYQQESESAGNSADSAKVRPYLIRAYYFSDDFAKAKQALLADLATDEKAGKAPPIENLQLLANSSAKTKDQATYLVALEKLVQFYPSGDYWTDLLSRLQAAPTYSERLQLDVLRLERAAVPVMAEQEYLEMGELALLAGFPTEAKKVADAGYAAGVLGLGANAARHKKLREQATKGAADDLKNIGAGEASANSAKDGTGLVNLGYAYVTMDQFDKGIELIRKGLAKGGLKRPEDGKLRLGIAYAMAKRNDEALQTLASVQGDDGLGQLARYWSFHVNRPAAASGAPVKQ